MNQIPQNKIISLGNAAILLVDGFNYTSKIPEGTDTTFFLTHAHSDHYTGIRADWNAGKIYCSEVTANLVGHILGVPPTQFHSLPLNKPTTLPSGIQVTLIDANHCPGAVIFLFNLPDGRRVIHTGDFRFSADQMLCCPHLAKFKGADEVYLDTTYANPKFVFPPQEKSIEYVANTIYHLLQEDKQASQLQPSSPTAAAAALDNEEPAAELYRPHSLDSQQQQKPHKHRRLFLISTYVIGKERILQAVSKKCSLRVHISDRKSGIMSCLPGLPEDMFTSNPHETPVHVVPWGFLGETWPFFRPNWKVPSEYAQAKGAESYVGFVPTGWVHGMAKTPFPVVTKGIHTVYLVPYSEHSSFDELIKFVEYLRPVKVVPTVISTKGDDADKDKALDKLLRRFTLVTDQDAAKAKFIAKMAGGGGGGGGKKIGRGKPQLGEDHKGGRSGGGGGGGNGKKEKEEEMPMEGGTAGEDSGDDGDSGKEIDIVELLDSEEEEDREEEEKKEKSDLEVLLGLTKGSLTPFQAQQLLKTVDGDISRAADVYFGGRWKAGDTRNKRSGSTCAVAVAAKTVSPVGTAGGGSKRRRTSGAGGSAGIDVPAGQRSILSFFGGTGTATATPTAVSPRPPPVVNAQPESQQQQQQQQEQAPSPPPPRSLQQQQQRPPQSTNLASIFQRPLPHSSISSKLTTAAATAARRDAVALPLSQYHPILNAPWHKGHPTPYLHLARAFEAMDATTKRIAISDILANTFRSVLILTPEDLPSIAYLAVGKIAPEYEQGMELSLGGSTVAAAVSEATGVTRNKLREMYNELGDLGDVAAKCKHTQATLARPLPLTVAGVHATLRGIAAERGPGAGRRRQAAVLMLLRSCREAETKYLVRTLVQALRVGANWRSVVPALAKAVVIHSIQAETLADFLEKEASPSTSSAAAAGIAQQPQPLPAIPPKAQLDAAATAAIAAFHVCPNLDLLIEAMHAGPMQTLEERCRLTPGVPIKPMLAKISSGIADAVTQLKGAPFVAEYKYDGVRAQIHLSQALSASENARMTKNSSDPSHSNTVLSGRTSANTNTTDSNTTSTASTSRVMVFSRNCEDRTMSFPDVAKQVIEAAAGGAQSCILDAEVVAVERHNNNSNTIAACPTTTPTTATTAASAAPNGTAIRLRPFQDLASRPRGPVDLSSLTVDICIFVFDILECDGVSLLGLPLRERRAALLKALPGLKDGYVQLAQGFVVDEPGAAAAGGAEEAGGGREEDANAGDKLEKEVIDLDDTKKKHRVLIDNDTTAAAAAAQGEEESEGPQLVANVESWLLEATAAGTEGLMLKSLDAAYQPSRRSESWIKLKKDYCLGLHESLDLVVIGAWYGSGRKAGWYSPFLLGVIDPESEEIQSLCRCMSGFTDEFYKAATARLKQTTIPNKKSYYATHESPDVWFNATEVWEIRGADLTLSPVHQAAVGKIAGSERGVGLRFPRFLRIRDDKSIDDATTADSIVAMYSAQERKA
ncbi:putative DNA ligase 6 [Nannochloris sp. 'desiccata']|nr:putative DNA ligase 6 [Chlorella desiccata (nom. nud.)]